MIDAHEVESFIFILLEEQNLKIVIWGIQTHFVEEEIDEAISD